MRNADKIKSVQISAQFVPSRGNPPLFSRGDDRGLIANVIAALIGLGAILTTITPQAALGGGSDLSEPLQSMDAHRKPSPAVKAAAPHRQTSRRQ